MTMDGCSNARPRSRGGGILHCGGFVMDGLKWIINWIQYNPNASGGP